MDNLAQKKCVPCQGGIAPLAGEKLESYKPKIGKDWKIINSHHLEKEFRFKDFKQALEFTDKVGELAESQGHHPDILLTWGKVKISLFTHKIDGLHENDFIMAAKIDEIT